MYCHAIVKYCGKRHSSICVPNEPRRLTYTFDPVDAINCIVLKSLVVNWNSYQLYYPTDHIQSYVIYTYDTYSVSEILFQEERCQTVLATEEYYYYYWGIQRRRRRKKRRRRLTLFSSATNATFKSIYLIKNGTTYMAVHEKNQKDARQCHCSDNQPIPSMIHSKNS